jgi:hypothetical protein
LHFTRLVAPGPKFGRSHGQSQHGEAIILVRSGHGNGSNGSNGSDGSDGLTFMTYRNRVLEFRANAGAYPEHAMQPAMHSTHVRSA